MGTDIHGLIQRVDPLWSLDQEFEKQTNPPKWVTVLDLKDLWLRHYDNFAVLFGAWKRPEIAGAFVGRGLPEDLHREDFPEAVWDDNRRKEDRDPIRTSWAYAEEVFTQEHRLDLKTYPDSDLNVDWPVLIGFLQILHRQHGREKVRLVVWFDD